MGEITIVEIDKEEVLDFAEERIGGILLGGDDHASYTVATVAPGERQRHHVQHRPDSGTEVMFVYRGRFAVRADDSADREYDIDRDGPVLVVCPSGTPCSIENRGDTEVRFFTVFAPPFAPGEIEYVE